MDACCIIAIILGLGNIVCWLAVFNKPFSLKSNGRELLIGAEKNNKELEKNVSILGQEITEIKELIKNGNKNHKPDKQKNS